MLMLVFMMILFFFSVISGVDGVCVVDGDVGVVGGGHVVEVVVDAFGVDGGAINVIDRVVVDVDVVVDVVVCS